MTNKESKKWSDNPDSEFFENQEKQTNAIKNSILKNGGHYFKNLNDELRNNPEIALFAIHNNPNLYIMEKANEAIRDNKEIALIELKNNGRAIGFLSNRLKADKEVAMMACSNFGGGLKYLSDELKQDEDVVCAAVTNDPFSIFQADSSMLHKKAVLNIAFKVYESNEKFYNDINSEIQVKLFTNHKERYELSIKLENELQIQHPILKAPSRRLKL